MRALTLLPLLALLGAPLPAAADALDDAIARGTVRLGVRADAPPFSVMTGANAYEGYSLDLCRAVVAEIARAADRPVRPDYVVVDAGNRIRMLAEGTIDLLCEATTITLGRLATVDFSVPTFVTGAAIMVRIGPSPIALPPLGGQGLGTPEQAIRRLGVLAGTTTEAAVKAMVAAGALKADVVDAATHGDGMMALLAGLTDAYAADLEILLDLKSRAPQPEALAVGERLLTLETYGIGIKPDERRLRLATNRTLARLYRSGEILRVAERHFPGRSPGDAYISMVLMAALPE